MKKVLLLLLLSTSFYIVNATNFKCNTFIDVVTATVFFDSVNNTVEINLDSKKEELDSFYTISIKDKNGKTVMDFKTNLSYNLINVSVFKNGTYTYQVNNLETVIKSGKFNIDGANSN